MRHLTLTILSILLLLGLAGSALAVEPGDTEQPGDAEQPGDIEQPRAASSEAPQALLLPPVDALGRPFPDPDILLRARRWTASGATLTVAGASMMMAGMLLASAALRGQIDVPDSGKYAFTGMIMGGPLLVFAGLPLLSSGNFVRGQLTRKIKGVPKVPRTVANEWNYWRAYRLGLYGQATVVAGGGAVMIGVLGMVAGAFSVGSELYRPAIWSIPASAFSLGAGMIVGGLFMQKASRAKMNTIRDAVDPYRQVSELPEAADASEAQGRVDSSSRRGAAAPHAGLPLPGISAAPDGHGGLVPRASFSWSLRF